MEFKRISFDGARNKFDFSPFEDIISYRDQTFNNISHENGIFLFKNGYILGRSMLPLSENGFLLDQCMCHNPDKISLENFNHRLTLKKFPGTVFLLDGTTPSLGHFILNALPRIIMWERIKEKFSDAVFVIRKDIAQSSFELLSIFCPGIKCIKLSVDEILQADDVIAPTMPECSVDGAVTFCPSFHIYFHHKIDAFADNIPHSEKFSGIYLSRQDATHRRIVNERFLIETLEKAGIEPIIGSRYSIIDQIKLARQSKNIVFPMGNNSLTSVFSGYETAIIQINPLAVSYTHLDG